MKRNITFRKWWWKREKGGGGENGMTTQNGRSEEKGRYDLLTMRPTDRPNNQIHVRRNDPFFFVYLEKYLECKW